MADCRCGHPWMMHGPELPGCCECRCRALTPRLADSTPTEREAGDVGEVAAVLATHYDPTTCVRDHGMRGDVPMVQAHTEHVAAALAPLIAEREAKAKGDAVRSMAHLFRDMAQESLLRRDVIHLCDLRADSYRAALAPENAQDAL